MDQEPGIFARIFEFLWALLPYWWLLVPGGVFVIEPMIEALFPVPLKVWLDKHWPRQRRRQLTKMAAVAALFVASFLAFDDVNMRNRNLEREVMPGGKLEHRHLTDDQRIRLTRDLRLTASEHYYFQINTVPSCDECEQYAEELRDFISAIPGWQAGGGPLIFPSHYPKGDQLVTRGDEASSPGPSKVLAAFADAGIPLMPETEDQMQKGSFVVVIGRR